MLAAARAWRELGEHVPDACADICRYTWASQGVMNCVGLTTAGRLLGHHKRRTTAIYAHLDAAALQDAAAQAAGVIAEAVGYRTEPPPLTVGTHADNGSNELLQTGRSEPPTAPSILREFPWPRAAAEQRDRAESADGAADRPSTVIGRPPAADAGMKRPPSGLVRI